MINEGTRPTLHNALPPRELDLGLALCCTAWPAAIPLPFLLQLLLLLLLLPPAAVPAKFPPVVPDLRRTVAADQLPAVFGLSMRLLLE
eukprot:CAMPEP_0194774120 /NCGR_PEP_ID=MMETSP0323_2-20130528/56844_1 /TAXON_ID=2866 ORGANISM="Crypthecodinium cohnii, Strain Seligo" /NCGR_SAMPLE_ID=MMETSP0323_2 /ASSEMBLY_ACC=CAM_ASM_000346 /LENGTH=87 /DNA_ID=CAMNT_0039709535 /DNA_START=1 /DNA_END=264 /DNA_ORIENTATION=-